MPWRFFSIAFRAALLAAAGAAGAHAAGRLVVSDAWIRTAPPGAAMLAGYATLHNAGDAPVVVRGARSDAFASVSLHETVSTDGVERMRHVDALPIAPGATVSLQPGGKHLMLMQPAHALAAGSRVRIELESGDTSETAAEFVVRDEAPAH